MNQTEQNILTSVREWLKVNWLGALIIAALFFGAGAVLAQTPTVTLTATVASGNVPTLTWDATGTTGCVASGGWTGAKASTGSQAVAAITATTTYTLTCQGTGSSKAVLTWTAPTQNTDGSALTNLAGFRVWRGPTPSTVNGTIATINSATTLTYTDLTPPQGQSCYAVTALNSIGVESVQSSPPGCKTIAAGAALANSVTIPVPGAPALVTVQTLAFEVRFTFKGYVLGRQIGTVPLGEACFKDFQVKGGYARIPRASVTPRPRQAIVVAQCAQV